MFQIMTMIFNLRNLLVLGKMMQFKTSSPSGKRNAVLNMFPFTSNKASRRSESKNLKISFYSNLNSGCQFF